MSKNITIKEGGTAKQLTIDKIKTNLVSGGSCLWVPDDEVQLTTKTITKNGTYNASDDGYYGYEQVVVSGVGSVSGTDPTTGEDVVVTADPETGEIVEETVPHSISVVTPPYNPYGTYMDGQAIDISAQSGFEVKALLASGAAYDRPEYPLGHIPNDELSILPTNADFSQTTGDRIVEYSEFGQGPWPQPLNSTIGAIEKYDAITGNLKLVFEMDGSGYLLLLDQSGSTIELGCSDSPGRKIRHGIRTGTGMNYSNWYTLNNTYTYENKTVYYGNLINGNHYDSSIPGYNENVEGSDLDTAKAAWACVYGTVSKRANTQEIKVLWPRPLDGKVLETTFEIIVAPPYSTEE